MNYVKATKAFMDSGMRVFQGALFSETDDEAEHCRTLMRLYHIGPGEGVVDMGCGIGGVCARFMDEDPTISCIGVTNEPTQLESMLPGVMATLADMSATGLPDKCADVVMFNESFGYGYPRALLNEAYRLLKPGGRLCIKDYDFLESSAAVGECEAAWGYNVHDPHVLKMYAAQAGFRVDKVYRRMPASFSRWRRFMGGYEARQDHNHPPHAHNIKAAVYVFTKDGETDTFKVDIDYALKGNTAAIQFCQQLYRIVHTWDDLVDKDKPVSEGAVNAAFYEAIIGLNSNPFFRDNVEVLTPVISSGIMAWIAANAFERSNNRDLWVRANTLRVQIGAAFVTCAELVGGYAWAVHVAPGIYEALNADSTADYLDEMEATHAQD